MNNDIFNDLFVLELANNHWGNLERGKKIISDFSRIVRFNNIKAAMNALLKLQSVEGVALKRGKKPEEI